MLLCRWRIVSLVFLLFLGGSMGWSQAIPSPLLHLTGDDLNVAACQAFVDGKAVKQQLTSQLISGVLGIQGIANWTAGSNEEGKQQQYLIVFTTPQAVGALLAQGNANCQYLAAGAALPADPFTAKWQDCAFPTGQSGWKVATLPPGTSVQALLVTLNRNWGDWNRLRLLRLFAPRLYNLLPDAIANAEAEFINIGDLHAPIPYTAANIVRGAGEWQNAGPDANGHVSHPILSATFPSWFVVSWDTPQQVSALRLSSNFRKFTVLTFKGPAGINPAIGGDGDWAPLPCSVRDDDDGKWIFCHPVNTRGIKLLITETSDARFARISGLHAYTDLLEKSVPVRQVVEVKPPCTFTYTLPADGTVTVVIDDQQGRRIRNITAREYHKAGPVTFGWDLKDETGQLAPVGAYHWKVLFNPGLSLKYQMTPYPNITDNTPDNSPWLNGASGPGGWLADHSAPRAVAVAGEKVFISAPCSESGVSLIECDTNGKKDWGYGNIIAWVGPSFMTSDGKSLYTAPWAGGTDYVWRFSLPDKKLDTMLQVDASATRKRGIRGMAARNGKLYLSINAGTDYLENAAAPSDVNLETCVPRYPVPPKTNKYDDPDPRADFLRIFRLTGTPPGCHGLIYLESTNDKRPRQHVVLAFDHPVPVGSLVFPAPEETRVRMHISVLKADAALPLLPRKDSQWTEIWQGKGTGWTVATAPPNTTTRAIRLSFDHGEADPEDEGADLRGDDPEAPATEDDVATAPAWQARLEGMKLLRRRFTNLFSTCKVTVNSGTVTPAGEWDAARTKPLTTANPGIYLMTWEAPQHIRGLAIKEIDGKRTEIDAWTGADDVPVDMQDTKHWTQISSYEQALRFYYNPDQNHNSAARYIDGYVDFGRTVTTRALRLRVVEQWMWKEEDRAGCVGVRRDRGADTLDPTRCRIYGVAPLQYLGDEAPVDMLATERLEVYDTTTNHLEKEWPLAQAGALTCAPGGALYAISAGQVVRFDPTTGVSQSLKLGVKQPTALACDHAGNLYVFDSAPELRVVKVFSPDGKSLRIIGTPGGRIAGPWDPGRFTSAPWVAVDLAIDSHDQLWVTECDFSPKRVSIWSTDGAFKKDLLGNTTYGGGGCLDPLEKNRLFYGPMEFALDWQTGITTLKGMTWMGDSPAGEMPIKVKDRLYMVTRPLFNRQAVGVVYAYQQGKLKRLAAVGLAGNFPPLRTSDVLDKLGKTPLGNCSFIWSDRNDDGMPQADEVEFFTDGARPGAPGRFEETLSIDAGDAYRYEVTGFAPNGAPLYTRVKKPAAGMLVKLANGNFFVAANEPNRAVNPAGATVWSYPSEGWGVHALYRAKPYTPAQVTAEFDVIGHETAHAGDLGEFLVTNTNTGVWHIWTADGMLAGQLFRDMRGPGAAPWSMPEHERGMELNGVTVGQEHFSGYFCRTADNKYYAVAGHNHISVVEVLGMDKFVRAQGELTVTGLMEQQAVAWNRQQLSRALYESAKLIVCTPAQGVAVDGDPREWETPNAQLKDRDAAFGMSYDENNLYVCFIINGSGPLKNTGNNLKRLFKSGAAVDLQIGVNPNAAVARTDPAIGDQRLLMTMVDGKPVAMLYQPNAPGAKPEEGWETHTMVFTTKFDRVVPAPDVQIAVGDLKDGYCLEAAIPLKTLGLTIHHNLQLKMDWGILVSGPQGTEVLQRCYWANPLTAIVSDEAAEAMLHPDLWGLVRFVDAGDKGDTPEGPEEL